MSGYKVDHEQVVKMSKIHTNKFIAKRLGISTRQVSRILAANEASKDDPEKRCITMDSSIEKASMEFLRDTWGDSYGKLAYQFGMSRQAVHKRLNN